MTACRRRTRPKKLGLVIDLDICVGCHACATACKEWNTGGHHGAADRPASLWRRAAGVWFNRVHTYEAGERRRASRAPCISRAPACIARTPACVTVCPTGASYKRAEDGIVLVDEDKCIGCKLCAWACPYGAREYRPRRRRDEEMHAVRRPHLQREPARGGPRSRPASRPARPARATSATSAIPTSTSRSWWRERGGFDLMPELGYRPVNKYLPPRRPPWSITEPRTAGRSPAGRGGRWLSCRQLLRLGRPCARSLTALHPAYSVIVFSTLSGAGYGLLALAALAGASTWARLELRLRGAGDGNRPRPGHAGASRFDPASRPSPERAWRAMSQWRSS